MWHAVNYYKGLSYRRGNIMLHVFRKSFIYQGCRCL